MQSTSGDFIDQLPMDQSSASQEEIEIVETIFKKENSKEVKSLAIEFKEPLMIMVLVFLILTFKLQIETVICKYVPKIGSSQLLVNLLIAFVVGFIFYFSKNLNLIKKKN